MKLGVPSFAGLFLLLVFPAADALARQDPALVKSAIDTFLRIQSQGLPGEVSYTISSVDPNNHLVSCTALEVSLPAGAKAWGRTSVSVNCREARGWTIFVPVHIRVVTDYLITAMPLAQGQAVTAGDVARQRGDLSDLPAGVLTDEREALGRTASMSVAAGRPLRADMLRQPVVIQQNQTVKVVSRGPGFQVTNEGRALTHGLDGQIVQVRLASGQVVSGVARTGGIVEIGF